MHTRLCLSLHSISPDFVTLSCIDMLKRHQVPLWENRENVGTFYYSYDQALVTAISYNYRTPSLFY